MSEKQNKEYFLNRNNIRRMSFQEGIKTFSLKREIIILLGILISIIIYTIYLIDVKEICYGVVLDAGSSGTKAAIYQWQCIRSSQIPNLLLEKTISNKFKIPLAHFGKHIDELEQYFNDIFKYIDEHIPAQKRAQTPIILGATAGMRLLTIQQQDDIIAESQKQMSNRGYYFPENKKNEWCSVISGQQEGAYLWAAMNYLLHNLSYHKGQDASTVATVDLGGASTQIAFVSARSPYGRFRLLFQF